jgi:hypothetical protein
MVAYCNGQTGTATFDKHVTLGGPIQLVPPADMTELNANDWIAWAQGSTETNTYTVDDTSRKIVGSGAVKFITDGGFDTSVSYPKLETAQWDLTNKTTLNVSFYATNTNFSFQNGSPWIRLTDSDGNYYQYQYYVNNGIYDLLNEALNTWRSYSIPIYAPFDTVTGWRRSAFGTPDMQHINRLEIHADTWGNGFNLWLDGVGIP